MLADFQCGERAKIPEWSEWLPEKAGCSTTSDHCQPRAVSDQGWTPNSHNNKGDILAIKWQLNLTAD